jgi:hypothetical protein
VVNPHAEDTNTAAAAAAAAGTYTVQVATVICSTADTVITLRQSYMLSTIPITECQAMVSRVALLVRHLIR